ncbi:MAG: SAM-dependent methyltransferase [bacterium]
MNAYDKSAGVSSVPAGIAREMAAEGGRVTFARFMELALTHPTDGYYSRTGRLLGRRGHFSTAPHLSPAFRGAVSRLLTELVDASLANISPGDASLVDASPVDASHVAVPAAAGPSGADAVGRQPFAVIELGGGEGDLVGAVLEGWQGARPELRERVVYSIVEIGEGLRARQRAAVSGMLARGWDVRWADALTGAVAGTRPGVIVGNEFVDALPVHLVDVRGPRPLEAWVDLDPDGGGRVSELWGDLSREAKAELRFLFGGAEGDRLRSLSRDGVMELRPTVGSLLRQIVAVMPEGCLLTVDYGDWFKGVEAGTGRWCGPSGEPSYGRTVRGYFRHQLVTDPYVRVGNQDLTADVDFRALDLHGRESGFETVLFTSVAALLLADGGEAELSVLQARAGDSLQADREAGVLEALLDEQGLGGSFKVMLQVRG